jgi:hypothetical protein
MVIALMKLETVAVGVGVSVGIGVGVNVDVGVDVGMGVSVGPNNCPGPQAERSELARRNKTNATREFFFKEVLRDHGRTRQLYKSAA